MLIMLIDVFILASDMHVETHTDDRYQTHLISTQMGEQIKLEEDIQLHSGFEKGDSLKEHMEQRHMQSLILLFSNAAFLVEFLIKLVAFEFKTLFKARLNMVDIFLCVLYSTLFIVDQVKAGHFTLEYEDLYWTNRLAFFSALRLIRLVLVARESKSLRVLLECVAFVFDAVGNFIVLLLIFLYVYSLLGMQLFAGRLIFDPNGSKIT